LLGLKNTRTVLVYRSLWVLQLAAPVEEGGSMTRYGFCKLVTSLGARLGLWNGESSDGSFGG